MAYQMFDKKPRASGGANGRTTAGLSWAHVNSYTVARPVATAGITSAWGLFLQKGESIHHGHRVFPPVATRASSRHTASQEQKRAGERPLRSLSQRHHDHPQADGERPRH